MGAQTLLLPVAALVALWLAGLGATASLAPRLDPAAKAALAAPVAAAVLVCASPLVLAHASPGLLAALVLGGLGLLSAARARAALAIIRGAAAPAAIAAFALVLSSAPALRQGNWVATSFGNADPYVWVSQARSLSSGPPPAPAATFPDRVSYEMVTKEHWPVGLPVGVGAVAALGRLDPAKAYEAFAAVVAALLALGVFGVARGFLLWRIGLSAVAGVAVAANGLLLLSTYFGWQAQLLLTVFGTLAVCAVPAVFDRRARRREIILPALFLAAGVATYGWVFSAFLALTAAAALACWLRAPSSSVGRPAIALRLAGVSALTLVLGLVPIVEAVWRYSFTHGRLDQSVLRSLSRYDWAFPSDGLGLVIRAGTQRSPGPGWTAFALVIAALLLVLGALRTRSPRNPRGYVLVAAVAVTVALLGALAVTGSSPYTSLKLMSYASPLLTLLALSSFAARPPKPSADVAGTLVHVGKVVLLAGAAVSFAITSVFTIGYAVKWVRPATVVDPVAFAAERLPASDAIRIDYVDAWRQSWLVYFLRDRRLAVPRPSVYLTGFAPADTARSPSFATPALFAVAPRHRGGTVWRGPGGVLYRIGTLR
jgi:hypothetical protein